MGELADHARRLLTIDGTSNLRHPSHDALCNDIAELEQRCAMMEAAASMAHASFLGQTADTETPVIIPDADDYASPLARAAMAERRESELQAENVRLRAIDNIAIRAAEQKAEQAMLIAGTLVRYDAKPMWTLPLAIEADYVMQARDRGAKSSLDVSISSHGAPFKGLLVVFDENDMLEPNPDHLERHATQLIEAGEELLRRYRQEQEAAGTPATTASMDAIARDVCAQIVENVERGYKP